MQDTANTPSQPRVLTGISLGLISSSVCAIVVAGLLAAGIFGSMRFAKITVGGSDFSRIIELHAFKAELLPPSMFVVEPFAAAQVAFRRPEQVGAIKQQIVRLHQEYKENIRQWQASSVAKEMRSADMRDALEDADRFWNEALNVLLPSIERGELAEARQSMDRLTGFFTEHKTHVDLVLRALSKHSDDAQAQILAGAEALKQMVMVLGIVLVIGIAGVGLALHLLVVRHLRALSSGMARLADGDAQAGGDIKSRIREIAALSRSLQHFREAHLERAALQERTHQLADAQQASLAALGNALTAVANGDLASRITTGIGAGFESLREDFNSTIEKIESAITAVRGASDAIHVGTNEIAQAAEDLSRRTENQAASLEEATAALGEVTDTVRQSAGTASEARSLVGTARLEAEKSGVVMRNAIDAMNGIETASKEINQIISVIDEIAFQTNLLALNAGVEAARAGDAGRGFAVVASEVRALAQRSAEAAKQIKTLIAGSTVQVKRGAELVAETGSVLDRIVAAVAEIDAAIARIAESANEQSATLTDVNTAVAGMDTVTQQNAAMVEQTTAATRTLAERTQELAALVARFRTGAPAARDDLRESLRKAAPHAFGERTQSARAKVEPAVARPTGVARRRVGARGGTVASDGWEEF